MDFIFKLHALFHSLYKDLLTVILKKQFRTIFSQAWYRSVGSLEMGAELEMEVQVAYLESRKGGCKAAWGIGEIKVQSRLDIALAPPVRKFWSKYCQSELTCIRLREPGLSVLHVSPTPSYESGSCCPGRT